MKLMNIYEFMDKIWDEKGSDAWEDFENTLIEIRQLLILLTSFHLDSRQIVGIAFHGDGLAGNGHHKGLHEIGILQNDNSRIAYLLSEGK